MLAILEPVVDPITVASHRITDCGIRVSRKSAPLNAEEGIITPRLFSTSLVILIENLSDILRPFRSVDTGKTYKHDIHMVCGVGEPSV